MNIKLSASTLSQNHKHLSDILNRLDQSKQTKASTAKDA